MRVAVAGGTGWVGRLVVDAVRAVGHEPVILARSTGVDLIRGSGLDAALIDVPVVIDVSNTSTVNRKKSRESGRAMAGRGLLPADPGPRGKRTFDQWLASPAAQSTTSRDRSTKASRPFPPRQRSRQQTVAGALC